MPKHERNYLIDTIHDEQRLQSWAIRSSRQYPRGSDGKETNVHKTRWYPVVHGPVPDTSSPGRSPPGLGGDRRG